MTKKKKTTTSRKRRSERCLIIPKAYGGWQVLFFERESDFIEFGASMDEDGRAYFFADSVLTCLGDAKEKPKKKAKGKKPE